MRKRRKRVYRKRRPCESGAAVHPDQMAVDRVGRLRKVRKVAQRERFKRCVGCTSFYPLKNGEWDCLSGMSGKPDCPEYERAIFVLVPGWNYSPWEIMKMRKAEVEMKKAKGEEVGR